jgi:hypothetical protein
MKNRFFAFFFLVLAMAITVQSRELQPESVTIKGKILDVSAKTQVKYATITLRDSDSLMVKNVSSDSAGIFVMTNVVPGKYLLTISAPGYINGISTITIPVQKEFFAGEFMLIPEQVTVGEVTVTSSRPVIQNEADKLIYNVQEDPQSRGSNLLQILKKIPGIQVENNKEISVNGNNNYMVLLNGRRSSLFIRDPVDIFKTLPASAVKQVEILASPPSRFESEGTGGVINLVLDQYTINGYRGSINQDLADPVAYTAGGYLIAKNGIFGLNSLGSYGAGRHPEGQEYEYIDDKVFKMVTESEGTSNGRYNRMNYNTEFNISPDQSNLFSFTLSGRKDIEKGFDKLRVAEYDYSNILKDRYNTENESQAQQKNNTLQADYEYRSRETDRHLLTLSFRHTANRQMNDYTFSTLERDFSVQEKGLTGKDDEYTEGTAQVDYVLTFGKNSFEAGLKNIFRNSGSDYFQANWADQGNAWLPDPLNSNTFSYSQGIWGGYSSLNLVYKNYTFRAGIRIESVGLDVDFRSTQTQINKSYFNVIPNIRAAGRFKKGGRFSVAYTQRVQRPGLMYLNPYVNKSEVLYHYYGNPGLDPALSHVFNLNYSLFKGKTNYGLSVSHSSSTNSIQSYFFVGADSILNNTFANIGRFSNTGLTINMSRQFFDLVSFSMSGSARYREYTSRRAGQAFLNRGTTYTMNFHASVPLWEDGYFSSSLVWSSGGVNLQGKNNSYLNTNTSLSWEPGGSKNLSINFSVDNVFNKMYSSIYTIDNQQFYMKSRSNNLIQVYTLSVIYRFGQFKGVLKRKARDIIIDDQVE